jgi:hypothetical protein
VTYGELLEFLCTLSDAALNKPARILVAGNSLVVARIDERLFCEMMMRAGSQSLSARAWRCRNDHPHATVSSANRANAIG